MGRRRGSLVPRRRVGVLQVGIATRLEASVTQERSLAQRAGARVRALAGPRGKPCPVYSEASFPIVGYAAGYRAPRSATSSERGWASAPAGA